MDKDNVISFQKQDYFEDPLTEVIRDGLASHHWVMNSILLLSTDNTEQAS